MTTGEYRKMQKQGRRNKYGAEKTIRIVNGQRLLFDSAKEAERFDQLRWLERAGKIHKLERQVPFELIPPQRDARGKLLEHGCTYRADFAYFNDEGQYIVEDVKGRRTEAYIIKRKLMLYLKGIEVKEA